MDIKKILIVEDDTDINHLLERILKKTGYGVISAFSGTEAMLRLEMSIPDLIMLDLMLPGMTGEEVIQKIREELNLKIPIIVLSAKSAIENKIETMSAGADDYITKPFENEEVIVRVMAVLRRYNNAVQDIKNEKIIYKYKNLILNTEARNATINNVEIALTPHEYEIVKILGTEPDKVFSREKLYEMVWQNGYYGEDNTVNMHVSNIRKKISVEDPEEEYIKTVWGIGFKMA